MAYEHCKHFTKFCLYGNLDRKSDGEHTCRITSAGPRATRGRGTPAAAPTPASSAKTTRGGRTGKTGTVAQKTPKIDRKKKPENARVWITKSDRQAAENKLGIGH